MIRLFVGLELPEPVRAELAGLCGGIPGARWILPENLHITLRFIGEVDEPLAEAIHENLERVEAPAFPLRLSGVGSFGKNHRASTVWAGVAPEPGLEHLHKKVESACVRAGCAPEGRKFTPHVTLARLKESQPIRLCQFEESHNLLSLGPFPVEAFTLFSSHLGADGAHYLAEARYALTPLARKGRER